MQLVFDTSTQQIGSYRVSNYIFSEQIKNPKYKNIVSQNCLCQIIGIL